MQKKYALAVGVERVTLLRQAPITPREAPVVRSLSRAIDEQLGREARYCGIGGGSIAGELRRRGYPAAVWRMAPFQEHSANESMSITSNLIEAAMMARLLFDPELAVSVPVEEGDPGIQPGQSK